MKKEDKDLLLKDLCARLPYGVKVQHKAQDFPSTLEWIDVYRMSAGRKADKLGVGCDWGSIEFIQPYLRPMSSMTEEEMDELYTAMDWYGEIDETGNVYTKGREKVYRETFYEYTDWLNAHHFDYRWLIEKGLALEAPEGIYKEE